MLSNLAFWRFVPLSGYFILLNELCERFSYYGMVAILPMFLTGYLGFKQATAVQIMSAISFSSYLFAFIGAIVSDSYIGRFKTIAIFSSLYAAGVAVLSLSGVPGMTGVPPHWWLTGIALFVIAFGTGGIKPCVSAFGGDQIESAEARSRFFSYFYLMVNVGSFASTLLVPLIKAQPCLGRQDCYTGAFTLPSALMVVAVIIFVAGRRRYKPGPPKNRIMLDFFGACGTAIWTKLSLLVRRVPHEPHPNWLLYASDKYPVSLLADSAAMLTVLKAFLPMCLYWGLYSQMSSRWVFQAAMMESKVGPLTIMAEQMNIINCILVLVFVPLFDAFLYPAVGLLCGRPFKPYARIIVSMVLGALSFAIAGFLQVGMESRGTFMVDPLNPESLKCVEGCVSILWQLPQYVVLTASEVLLCTATLSLVYAMAPPQLKSLCNAMSFITNAVGNLIVMAFAKVDPIGLFFKSKGSQATGNFFLWAALCVTGLVWFVLATWSVHFPEDKDEAVVAEPEMVLIDTQKVDPVDLKDELKDDWDSTKSDPEPDLSSSQTELVRTPTVPSQATSTV